MQPREDATRILKELLAGTEPPELGPGPRPGVRPQAELESALNSLPTGQAISSTSRELARALVLLWHDHLEAAHRIVQDIENSDGSLVHAIMHRREPDYWNSKYWWRRVGKHPCFVEMARRVTDFLKSKGERELSSKLVPRGDWDAFAFVDACQAVAGLLPSDERVQLLREVQRIEFGVFLAFLLGEKENGRRH